MARAASSASTPLPIRNVDVTWTGTTVYFSFGPPQFVPRCADCGRNATQRLTDGTLLCDTDLDRRNRENAITCAERWMTAAFAACITRDQRSKLYRNLAAVFHPDTGGDVRLMQALNAVKERFS